MPLRIRKEVNPEAPDVTVVSRPSLEWLSPARVWKSRRQTLTEEKKDDNIIHRPLLLIRVTLRILGLVPFSFADGTYRLRWCSPAGIHTIVVMLWLSGLVVTTSVGIARLFYSDVFSNSGNHTMELMGVGIIAGCLLNAWTDALILVFRGRPVCAFLNDWHRLARQTGLNPTLHIRRTSCIHACFLFAFVIAMAFCSLLGPSEMLMQIVRRLAQVVLLIPEQWLQENTPEVKAALVIVALIVCHIYLSYKGPLLIFVSVCKMLTNSLKGWRTQLSATLDAIWREVEGEASPPDVVGLDQLVQSHWEVVKMVRNTERLFSATLQCFYATQVVTMCLELYLVAYRVGMQTQYQPGEALWQSLIITQTFVVFLLVSMQASAVFEEAEASVDVIRRGLPFSVPEKVKFHFGEVTTSLTGSPICITGGKFFYIHRPFIVTVVGAVLSYFIIILQLMLPSVGRDHGEPLLNHTANESVVLEQEAH